MRLGEILGTRWISVDLERGEVRLDAEATKNDEPRSIPLLGELQEMLSIEREKNPGLSWSFCAKIAESIAFTRLGDPHVNVLSLVAYSSMTYDAPASEIWYEPECRSVLRWR